MPNSAQPQYASARVRMTAGERRAAILAAARTEFARTGYHGASTASIARAAGCSEPMLYKHFSSKQELFGAVLEQVSRVTEDGFDAVLSAPGDLVGNLLRFLPLVMHSADYVEAMQLRKLAITLVREPKVRETLAAMQQRHTDRVAGAFERARQEGDVREDVVPEDVAWMWTGLTLAGCYREALEPGGFAAMLPTVVSFIESLRSEPT